MLGKIVNWFCEESVNKELLFILFAVAIILYPMILIIGEDIFFFTTFIPTVITASLFSYQFWWLKRKKGNVLISSNPKTNPEVMYYLVGVNLLFFIGIIFTHPIEIEMNKRGPKTLIELISTISLLGPIVHNFCWLSWVQFRKNATRDLI